MGGHAQNIKVKSGARDVMESKLQKCDFDNWHFRMSIVIECCNTHGGMSSLT